MKKVLQKLFGYHFVFMLTDMKRKWIPNHFQKEMKEKEEDHNQKSLEFYRSFINKGDLVFDVGANIGNRVKPLLNIEARVVAIEPQKSCYKYLEYKFGKKISIVRKGLGEKEEIKEFHISDYSVISSFSDEWIESVKQGRFKNHSWNKKVNVEMTTLDKLIEKYGLPTFIKIDVEGYEVEVLKGLTKPIEMISFEYTVPEQTNKAIDCIDQLNKINSNIEFNYCFGENMQFAREDWITHHEMKSALASNEFLENGFGDIYVRNNR